MTPFTYTILSSVPREEITQYFHAHCKRITQSENHEAFIGVDWTVMLEEPKAKSLGHFTLYHTPIIFSGRKASVLHQVELFRLSFLSAGG